MAMNMLPSKKERSLTVLSENLLRLQPWQCFWITITIALLLLSEKAEFIQIVFETISAFGTVGLSMGITPHLTWIGKILIMLTMFFGRVGLITIALSLGMNSDKTNALSHIKYPEEKIIIG
jgi:trk system potassium uptake protein TrkH